jgi:hypothetical protein
MMSRLASLCLIAAACSDDPAASPDAPPAVPDAPVAVDAPACARTPKPADRTRRVVISLPYDAAGAKANQWEVLDLSPTGELSRPGRTFTMGRSTGGELAFTADGEIGLAVQEDGSLGVFRIDDAGVPTVITAKLDAPFYAARVVMAGDHAYVLDDQWRENGGGIYRVDIGCDDDTVTARAQVVAAKLPSGLAFAPGSSRALLVAHDVGGSPAGTGPSAHLLDAAEPLAVMATQPAFTDDMAIVGSSALTADGAYFLIGDNSGFASVPNRVAVVPVTGDQLRTPTVIPDISDPVALVASPYAPVVLVVSGFGDALLVIARDPDGVFRNKGELTYQGGKPQLPFGAVRIDAGTLRGLVLVAENAGVRLVQFRPDGTVVDRGRFGTGAGLVNVVGAIGVQP